MKKLAAMLMLVCSLGVFGVVGCEKSKSPETPKATGTEKPTEKPGEKMAPEKTPPATPEKK